MKVVDNEFYDCYHQYLVQILKSKIQCIKFWIHIRYWQSMNEIHCDWLKFDSPSMMFFLIILNCLFL